MAEAQYNNLPYPFGNSTLFASTLLVISAIASVISAIERVKKNNPDFVPSFDRDFLDHDLIQASSEELRSKVIT